MDSVTQLDDADDRITLPDERLVATAIVDFSEGAYKADNNPAHAWGAYLECRQAGLAIPEWVLACFDKFARTGLKRKRSAKVRALERASYFHALRVTNRPPISAKMDKKMDGLAKQVGRKFGKSMSQIYRDWYRYKHLFENVKGSHS